MKAIAALIGTALLASTAAAADDMRTERVHFKKGATSATVEDSISGYQSVDYVLGARQGQSMNVSMATDNTANYLMRSAARRDEVARYRLEMIID